MPRCSIQSIKEGKQIKQIYIQTKEQLLYGYILSSQENHSEFLNPTEQSYRPNLMLFVVQSYNYIITPFFLPSCICTEPSAVLSPPTSHQCRPHIAYMSSSNHKVCSMAGSFTIRICNYTNNDWAGNYMLIDNSNCYKL